MTPRRDPPEVHALVARVRETVAARGMLKGGERVLLAVSGGPDSLAMLHVLAALAPAHRLDLHVAHLDHGMRADSAKDAAFVRREAGRLGLPVTLGAAGPERAPGESPEESLRIKRRAFLEGTAEALGAHRIATAHTMDDQAETVLMRLLQGAGRRGLGGIPPLRWWFMRPLIDARRTEVEAFCRAAGLRPRIDPSNADRAYLRNVIRHETLPMLAGSMNERLTESLARLADVFRDEDAYLDEHAADVEGVAFGEQDIRLRVETLRSLPPALQRRMIRLLSWTNDGSVYSGEQTERIRSLALTGETGSRVDLPHGVSAWLEYGSLVLGRTPSPARRPAVPVEVPGEADVPAWGLRVRSWVAAERPAEWPDGRRRCVLDADLVPFPLTIRHVRPGDRFRPLGMARSKKVGDFFTDRRVPVRLRQHVPLLAGRDGVVWVVGHRIDDRVKVTAATRRFLWISVEEG